MWLIISIVICNLRKKCISLLKDIIKNKYCLIKVLMKEGWILITRSVTIKREKIFNDMFINKEIYFCIKGGKKWNEIPFWEPEAMKQKGEWMIEIKEIINAHLVEAWNCFTFCIKDKFISEWKRGLVINVIW